MKPSSHQRRDIQGLRAIAVLAVIANHLFEWPSGGFVGVDVFFVVSGFLITGVLLREYERTGTISFTGFYIRRIKRIAPAATLVILVTLAAALFLFGRPRFVETAIDGVWAFLSGANWRFALAGTDYFAQGQPPSPFQHYWSLGVEEQFYLVWPWLMLGVLVLAIRVIGVHRRRTRVIVGVAIGVIAVASVVWAIIETQGNATTAYFSTFSRAWELGVGALVAVAGGRLAIRNAVVRAVLAWVGVAAIVASLFLVPQAPGFPAPWALLPVLATALVIAAGVGGPQRFVWPLTNPVSRYIGDVSYSLYLWHFPVLVLLVALLPSDSVAYFVIVIALTAILSVLSYHLVENPLRSLTFTFVRGGRRRLQPAARRSLQYLTAGLLTIAAVVVGGSALTAAPQASSSASASGTSVTQQAATGCLGAAAMDPALDCPAFTGTGLYPAPAAMLDDTAGAFDCWKDPEDEMKTCSYGNGAKRVALIGDSHAAMLLPALKEGLAEQDWTLDTYVGWACQWTRAGAGPECENAMTQIQEKFETGDPYDIIIVTGAREKTPKNLAWYSKKMVAAWKPVAARGTKIVVVADNPGVTQQSLECVNRIGFSVENDDCVTSLDDAFHLGDPLIAAQKKVKGASLVDLTDFYCTDDSCPMVIGNVIVYRDDVAHLTATFSRSLKPYLFAAIDAAVEKS